MGYKINRIMMWVSNTTRGLPAEYQEVEYVESSGSQYIDTGFYPTGSSEIEFDFMMLPSSGTGSFGVDSGWTNSAFSVFTDRILCYGSQYQNQSTYFTDNTKYKLEFKNLTGYLNGTQMFTYTAQTFTSSYSCYVFAKRRNNSIEMYAKCRVYGLKLWNSGTLEKDFVPCYRKSDSVIGLYDLVNDEFKVNSGSGTFSKGADIPDMVEKQVRPAVSPRTPGANTIAYYKFNGDSLDYSGNNYDITSVTSYNTLSSGIKVAYFNGNGGTADTGNCNTNLGYNLFKVDQDITISFYVKVSSFGGGAACPYRAQGSGSYRVSLLDLYSNQVQWGLGNGGWNFSTFNTSISTSDFQHIVLVYDHTNKTASMYKNGELVSTVSTTGYSLFTNCNWVSVGFSPFNSSASEYLSEMIFENKKRNAQEIADYYNLTKSNYGIS